MYAIYGNIYPQYTPNVSIYTSTIDPMGMWALRNRWSLLLKKQFRRSINSHLRLLLCPKIPSGWILVAFGITLLEVTP